jgi:hypothetical protein
MPEYSGHVRRFTLKPFRGEGIGPDLAITGSIGRSASSLSLDSALRGDLRALAIPAPDSFPRRKDRLWEETCLEFFLGIRNSEGYWEFHLSPAGKLWKPPPAPS